MKITKKIVKVGIETDAKVSTPDLVYMNEKIERPEVLEGSTYKLQVPEHISPHALYITINDVVLNKGTDHEVRRPFEVFINSRNMEHFQWTVALTRVISAVFRKGGDITFLIEELESVFDPRGGYWGGGKFVPSLIGAIGGVLRRHLDEGDLRVGGTIEELTEAPTASEEWRDNAQLCPKCMSKGLIVKDGCKSCLDCGDSACG